MRLALAVLAVLLPSLLLAQDAARVGFEENFDAADGWTVVRGAPLKSLVAKDGQLRFETVCGALNSSTKRPDWPEWPEKPFPSSTTVRKNYGARIDLTKYRYLVVRMPERGTAVTLHVAGYQTPVCYTTGLLAYDLRYRDIHGQADMSLVLDFLNSSGCVTFDSIQLVSELTGEEKAALMPPPVVYREEKLTVPPYHNLEAMNARSGRSRRPECEGQQFVYRDSATRGEVWVMTDQPGDQAFRAGDSTIGWSRDGRYFAVTGGLDGKNVFDYASGQWRETRGGGGKLADVPKYVASWDSDLHDGVVYGYDIQWRRPECDFIFYRFDRNTGEQKEFARFTCDGKWDVRELTRGLGDKVAIALRGTPNVWLVDPEAKDPAKAITYVKLPTRLKGLGFADGDTKLCWFNCYTYEQRVMDLKTGEVTLGYYTAGGHAGGGGGWTLRHYSGMTTIQPEDMFDWRGGDKVKIFAYYRQPIGTDYGKLIDGGRWWLVNGTSGDVADQHIMVDGKDCATILRLCGYNTSRNNWSTNTYSIASPDTTKVAWASDQLGDGDVCAVVARRPDPVRNLKLAVDGENIKLTWEAPERAKETAGYVVCGAEEKGPFNPLHLDLIEKTEWSGAPPKGVVRFLVTAREWSGIESIPSPVVALKGFSVGPVHLDVWQGEKSRTARVVFDGTASTTRCVRAFKASPAEEVNPFVEWTKVNLPAGKHVVWMRQRGDEPGSDWEWKQLSAGFDIAADKVGILMPEGMLVDKVIISDDPDYTPRTADDRFAAPAKPTDVEAEVGDDGRVTLKWSRSPRLDHSRVEIFAGADPDFACTNETVIGAVSAPRPQMFFDWDQKPGKTVVYKLVAVGPQGQRAEPVVVRADIPTVDDLSVMEVSIADARANANIEKVERGGERMLAPKPIAPGDKAAPAKFVELGLPMMLPADGRYAIWVRYAPGYSPRTAISAAIDDGEAGDWKARPPYRPMSTMFSPPGGAFRVYTDRLNIGATDVFELKKGPHVLRFLLDPAMPNGQVHAISKIYITADPSFRPDGFDPRADFKKR